MLLLTRQEGESLTIGESITVTVMKARTGEVRIGIELPRDVPVVQTELLGRAVGNGLQESLNPAAIAPEY